MYPLKFPKMQNLTKYQVWLNSQRFYKITTMITVHHNLTLYQTIVSGRGVFATKRFEKGDFLLQYSGEILSGAEGDAREEVHSSGFRYFFKYNEVRMW